jgi:dipeptidyl aminopeptidase/acylaminoacyl peptidase
MYKTSLFVMIMLIFLVIQWTAQACTSTPVPAISQESPKAVKAEIWVVSVDISPNIIDVGETAFITVNIVNAGKANGAYLLVIKINGIEKFREEIVVSASGKQIKRIDFTGSNEGVYVVEVDGLKSELKVGLLGQDSTLLKGADGKILRAAKMGLSGAKAEVYKILYSSDGLKVVGYIAKPIGKNKKYPAVIYNRGGNREYGRLSNYDFQLWTAFFISRGYVVVGSQYRGVDGGEGQEQFGGDDVNDVLYLIPLLESLPFVDPNNLVMFGWSRGGLMTYITLTKTERINAAVIGGGVTDLIQEYNNPNHPMKQVLDELV